MSRNAPPPARPAPPAPRPDPIVARFVQRELSALPPRASSLVVTVWGDAIAPHGGAVLLPGLIRLLAPFRINERLVRTSVFRLAREGWLEATPVGRRSLYRLTRDGARRFELAYRRIYTLPVERWDDTWELLVAGDARNGKRRRLGDELRWEGFGAIAPGVWARPTREQSATPRIVAALGLSGEVLVVRARDEATAGAQTLAAAVPRLLDLSSVAADYRRFLRRFGTVIDRFRRAGDDGHHPEQSFVVRTLLIHEYRRVLLRDPQLPAALLPLDWPGPAAFALCRDFYRLTHRAAERHLAATLEGARGALPPAGADFYRRFGGLAR
jgi:phenylacetic acid degradation operon negative regulatory protein